MPKSASKLRPCPFCGEDQDLTLMSLSGVRVACDCCGAEGPVRKNATAAKKAWNERDGHSLNDQVWCLVEIRRIVGDPEGRLMQPELIERVRELAERREAAIDKEEGRS